MAVRKNDKDASFFNLKFKDTKEPETTEHLVKYCPAFADKRKDKLGEYFLTKSLDKYKLNKILTFVNVTNRLMYNIQENE